MSTQPSENPTATVITFTARGDAALDQLADALVAGCDGSPASIADTLERVLCADVEELADALGQTGGPPPVAETGSAAEGPDQAARRRLAGRREAGTDLAGQIPGIDR